jgi:hypothetical protein
MDTIAEKGTYLLEKYLNLIQPGKLPKDVKNVGNGNGKYVIT